MELILDKESVGLGESITGKVKLDMKKPASGNELYVRLIGTNYEGAEMDEGEFELPETTEFYNQKHLLAGEQEYASGAWDFEIPIPGTIANPKKESDERERWYVNAYLDKKGLDLKKKKKITVE